MRISGLTGMKDRFKPILRNRRSVRHAFAYQSMTIEPFVRNLRHLFHRKVNRSKGVRAQLFDHRRADPRSVDLNPTPFIHPASRTIHISNAHRHPRDFLVKMTELIANSPENILSKRLRRGQTVKSNVDFHSDSFIGPQGPHVYRPPQSLRTPKIPGRTAPGQTQNSSDEIVTRLLTGA